MAFAYRLAADLNVNLRFVPFAWETLIQDLQERKFDIAMSGIYVTDERLTAARGSHPYFQSPLAFFLPRERVSQFRSHSQIAERPGVRIGVFNDPVLVPRIRQAFPRAEVVIVQDYATLPDFSKIDAAVWTLTQAEAMAATHSGLVAVEPSESGNPCVFAYLMPHGSEEFVQFVDYWLDLKKVDGFEMQQRSYWIERRPRTSTQPRWSILRNILGFGL